MDKNKQIIALAEFDGYTNIHTFNGTTEWGQASKYWDFEDVGITYGEKYGLKEDYFHKIPDYTSDLNSIHRLENKLEDGEQYRINLHSVCGFGRAWKDSECNPEIAHSEAGQRAEAILKTIGKWED